MKKKHDSKLIFRLPRDSHMAIKRMAVECGVSINTIMNILVDKSIPKKYYDNPYEEKESE
jgi:predicted HicB family RNase H-like nuclease